MIGVPLFQFAVELAARPAEVGLVTLFDRCVDVAVEHDAGTGRTRARFDRTAPTLVDAVVSGVRDLDRAGLAAARVVPDDDLITAAGVATRLGLARPATDRLLAGGSGPVWRCADEPLYLWSEIVARLHGAAGTGAAGTGAAGPTAVDAVVEAVNLTLRLRALSPRVERMAAIRALIMG